MDRSSTDVVKSYNAAQFRCLNPQYVKRNSIATLKELNLILWGCKFFNKQQTAYIQGKIIQFDVALQINALNYTRFTVITDKHVKSHFVLIVTEISENFLYIPLIHWLFVDFRTLSHLTFYTWKPEKEVTIRLTEWNSSPIY